MGMFDYNTGYSEGLTPGQRARRRADQAEQQLVDRQISPFVEKHTGYVSPKTQLKRMAAKTDLSDGQAVQQTYNAILAKNPTAAKKWLESVKPIIQQHIEQQQIAATAKGKVPDERKQQLIDAEKGEVKAANIANLFGVADTVERKEQFLNVLNKQGLANTNLYKETQNQINILKSSGFKAGKQKSLEEHRKAEKELKEQQVAYKNMFLKGQGKEVVKPFFLANTPEGEQPGDNLFDAMVGQVGASVEAYDKTLQADYAEKGVTPSEAKSYYNKVLALPQVYTGGSPLWGGGDARFDSAAFDGALNKTFGRKGEIVYEAELKDYLTNGLIIPGKTVVEVGGMRGMVSPKKLEQLRRKYGVE